MMRFFYDTQGGVCAYSEQDLSALGDRVSEFAELSPQQQAEHLNPAEPPITAEKLKAIVTAFRWEVETGGITMPDGRRYDTSRESQTLTRTALLDAQELGREAISFGTLGTWYTLTPAELQAVCLAIGNHRQACRDAERAHHEAIDALVVMHQGDAQALQTALDGYDESQGWPNQGV